MIPVPVPFPVPCGGPLPAVNAPFHAAAGRDLYNAMAFQQNHNAWLAAGYPCGPGIPTPQHAHDAVTVGHQPPPGFVPPPGFKLVRAPATMSDMHSVRDFDKQPPQRKETKSKPDRSKTKSNGKVFVGGLTPVTTIEMLRDHFSKFGNIVDVSVIKDPATKKSRGFGFVEFDAGVPPGLLEMDHVIDNRICGVKP